MKVNRLSKENDPCETSIEFLVERCEQFFESNPQLKSESRYYPESSVHAPFDSEGLTDVVLFGNAYKTIFQSGNWPFEKLRLWVLSHSLKEFFENEFSQGEFKVNLIPRSEILKVDPAKDCAGSGPVQYIYAGRLSFQKNLKLLLATFEELKKSKPDSELHLFGDFDDTIHENLGRRVRESYRDELENFRRDFTSNEDVYFHGKVERDDWIKREWSNPTFISLSTFLSEDFGVSASQAAAEGWPIILSQFGGHRDVEASKLFHIGSELCLNDHLPNNLLKAVGKVIACNIQEATFYAHFPSIEKTNHSFSLEILDKHRRRWAKHFGTSVSQLGYEYLTTFADHPMGRSFL
ncbi:MAG: glycosyltransferase, partial [Halobacteriovoraceae bacterium]|nr:glycosyltransferase [Halobacteriovoraceae bacterium]